MTTDTPQASGTVAELVAWMWDVVTRDADEARAGISDNSPSEVLAQCEATAAVLDEWVSINHPDTRMAPDAFYVADVMVGALGLAYQHRPGYQEAWRP